MDKSMRKDTTLLDSLIIGRVDPHIYAFSTETVPNYLKIGDTARGVRVRLDEWRKIFPNLIKQYEHSAQIDEKTIFRDYSVHTFLEKEKGRERLHPDTFRDLPYYSNEFFKDASIADLNEAISDIHQSAIDKDGKYQFYSPDRLPQTFTYERKDKFRPRDNQQQVINNFKTAVASGRTDLLLYAVMRFGKSFTAMCCAKAIEAKVVVIVSAKPKDIEEEWKKTVESHVDFIGYKFLNCKSLRRNESVIADTLAAGNKVALFLSLQDLQGEKIKAKHKEVFEHHIDLLIIDETHFGARAASYGKVLQEQCFKKSEIEKELKGIDGFDTLDQVEDAVKTLDTKIRIHLSGTPYRILMGGEFQKEDIIAFVQFTDIIDAQKQWDDEHLKEDECNEWDNPYYGFPQMIRFAFNPNVSSVRKIEELRQKGITYVFFELFHSQSMAFKVDGTHRQFIHEPEILDLLEVIDGTKEDENMLGFLDYDKIKEGKMCRHIVMVLPFRAFCDAMSALINRERERFKNLSEYEIINIAGFDEIKKYKSTDDVKRAIKTCEENKCKTLTLTVNRMLTGTTVPQWDTMIYLKGTSSPQEYDQAVFRLQNQYVTTFKDENGKVFKYNMKPQTLLVDFDPNRMFRLQEMKSQIYNANTEVQGNVQLKERIAKELSISTIIVLNKNKLQEVTPANITDAVREYSRNRSIMDDATEVPVDNNLLDDANILNVIQCIAPIDAKNGLQIKPTEGEGDDYDIRDEPKKEDNVEQDQNNTPQPNQQQPLEDDKLAKRLAAYYARILFFAFLTESRVRSLEEIIKSISSTEDNRRIAKNTGIDLNVLKVIQQKSNPFILQKLDYKIENVNDLIRDTTLIPLERVEVAMRKFGRLSDSEIVTPAKVADEMVAILPFEKLDSKEDAKFLDIASKQGEFSIALYKRFGENVKNKLYAIPTSKLAYEFTRKIYILLGMSVGNIFTEFTSYDLVGNNNGKIIQRLIDMNFQTIIGNPPYQETLEAGRSLAKQLFPSFIETGIKLCPKYLSLITPARWFTADAQDNSFPKLREFVRENNHISLLLTHNGKKLFPNTELGVVNYFLWDKDYNGDVTFVEKTSDQLSVLKRPLFEKELEIIIPQNNMVSIIQKVKDTNFIPLNTITSGRDAFGITGKNFKSRSMSEPFDGAVAVQCAYEEIRYVTRDSISKGADFLENYKVFTSKGNGGAGLLTDGKPVNIIGKSYVGLPNMACTDSLIPFGKFKTITEAQNLQKYMSTKFLRFCVGVLKVSQNLYQNVYGFVPLQDFTSNSDIDWNKSIPKIDAQLYDKYGLSEEEISFIESIIKSM